MRAWTKWQLAAIPAGLLYAITSFHPTYAAEPFPNRPVRLVGTNAAGVVDAVARLVGQHLSEKFGYQVVVDARPGANGAIAAQTVAEAAPDGYTLMVTGSNHTIVPLVHKVAYHAVDSFAPIAMIGTSPYVLVVDPKLPIKTVKELIDYAKARPGEMNYASPGKADGTTFAMELLKQMTGTDIVNVSYADGNQMMLAILRGEAQVGLTSVTAARSYIKNGSVRPLAVTTNERLDVLPDVPLMRESLPGLDAKGWQGILAPAKTPKEVVQKLNRDISAILDIPEVKERIATLGLLPPPAKTQEEFTQFLKADFDRWGSVLKSMPKGKE